jgi:predicted O-methyltransferase YrrM
MEAAVPAAKDVVRRLVRPLGVDLVPYRTAPVDFSSDDVALLERVRPYTMTTPERVFSAANAARYVADANIPGALVECGVWRGGSSMAMALALLSRGVTDRDLYLFDTYEGMSAPTDADLDHAGRPAREKFEQTRTGDDTAAWCAAPLDDVRANLAQTGYPAGRVHLVKGKVEDTLPGGAPEQIALLRLDTDWYESTKHELETLYPRLVSGGVLILDDYGHWQGSRRAVDEYLAAHDVHLLLNRIDYTGRIAVKP